MSLVESYDQLRFREFMHIVIRSKADYRTPVPDKPRLFSAARCYTKQHTRLSFPITSLLYCICEAEGQLRGIGSGAAVPYDT